VLIDHVDFYVLATKLFVRVPVKHDGDK